MECTVFAVGFVFAGKVELQSIRFIAVNTQCLVRYIKNTHPAIGSYCGTSFEFRIPIAAEPPRIPGHPLIKFAIELGICSIYRKLPPLLTLFVKEENGIAVIIPNGSVTRSNFGNRLGNRFIAENKVKPAAVGGKLHAGIFCCQFALHIKTVTHMTGIPDILFHISSKIHLGKHRNFERIGHKRYPNHIQQNLGRCTGKTHYILYSGSIFGNIKKLLISLIFIAGFQLNCCFFIAGRSLFTAFFVKIQPQPHSRNLTFDLVLKTLNHHPGAQFLESHGTIHTEIVSSFGYLHGFGTGCHICSFQRKFFLIFRRPCAHGNTPFKRMSFRIKRLCRIDLPYRQNTGGSQ